MQASDAKEPEEVKLASSSGSFAFLLEKTAKKKTIKEY